jgi:hypothetical protein
VINIKHGVYKTTTTTTTTTTTKTDNNFSTR